jgi:hypothetical protein
MNPQYGLDGGLVLLLKHDDVKLEVVPTIASLPLLRTQAATGEARSGQGALWGSGQGLALRLSF